MEPSGWMTYGGFVEWLKFFINRVGCTPKRKDLLILDGNITHVKNVAAIELARSNGVVMIRPSPHCTHRMQPEGCGLFLSRAHPSTNILSHKS